MNPAFLDNMSWEMAEVYGAITDQIIINMARYFPYIKAGNVPNSAFDYQAAMLAQMGQVNKDTVRIIRRNLVGANKALKKVLEQAIIDSVSKTEPELLDAVKRGIFKPAGIPVVAPNQMRAFQLYYQQAAQKLNLVNTVMLESTQQAYQATVADVAARVQATQTALDIATGETITGVSSWNAALRHSMDRLKLNGITGFIDHGGHKWSAEAYVAMDIRTTVYNTGRAAVWETNQNFGNDLYIVSYHDGARPLCYPWQNKVISSTNNARTVQDLDGNEIPVIAQSDTSYGQPAGLFGINCKHYPSPFIPGVSVLYDESNIPSEAENEKIYEQTQQQRALERKIREEKRDLLMEKARGADDETLKAMREKIRQTSDDIDKFCDETGLPRRQNREGVFTQREFPAADTYDVTEFERKQKDEIEEYFKKGGAQQEYTFGQMTPNEPTLTNTNTPSVPGIEQTEVDINEGDKSTIPTPAVPKEVKTVLDSTPQAYNESRTNERPANEQPVLQQFNRFDTSKRTADQMLKQINPNYSTGERAWTYNCQRTVTTQELVERGYDVTAMPYDAKDPISNTAWNAWKTTADPFKDPGIIELGNKKTLASNVKSAFNNWGDGSRAMIRVKWNTKNGGNGHFIYAKRVGNDIIYSDGQSGEILDIDEVAKRTTQNKHEMWVMRLDNREVNSNIVYAVKNRE